MFPDRELVAITHPMGPECEEDPGDIEELLPNNLSPNFTNDVIHLKEKIFNDTPIKKVWSRKINGKILSFLIKDYVLSLNSKGSRVNFSQSWHMYLDD